MAAARSEEFGVGSAEHLALCGPAGACPLVNGDVGNSVKR